MLAMVRVATKSPLMLGVLSVLANHFLGRNARCQSTYQARAVPRTGVLGAASSSQDSCSPSCLTQGGSLRQRRWALAHARHRPISRERGSASEQAPVLFMPLSTFFLVLMVCHKCLTDGLSRVTRTTGVPYSATTASLLGELVTVPLLLGAVLTFEGRAGLRPVLKSAVKDAPFALALPGLAYSVQNILYFEALSHLSVASYQVLSQSKLLFTGLFMSIILKHSLSKRQFVALVLLMFGTILTQLSEMSRGTMNGGNALYGGMLAVAGAALSALPNVYYEKVLKTEGHNLWSKNIQLSFWIWFWLVVISLPSLLTREGLHLPSGATMMTGITAWVWLVIVLQSCRCLLVPATLKYGDNILYSYAKPSSIVLTALVSAVTSGILPGARFVLGAAFVLLSMRLYGA